MRVAVVGIILHVLLVGCGVSALGKTLPEPKPTSQVADLLAYFNRAQSLPAAELKALYDQEEKALSNQDNQEGMLRLAMLLTLRDTAFYNPDRAVILLEKSRQSRHNSTELRQFSSLLLSMVDDIRDQKTKRAGVQEELEQAVTERRAAEEKYREMKRQLEVVQSEKQAQETENKKIDAELAEKRQMVDDLRKQIDQLKSIEKSITDRKNEKRDPT